MGSSDSSDDSGAASGPGSGDAFRAWRSSVDGLLRQRHPAFTTQDLDPKVVRGAWADGLTPKQFAAVQLVPSALRASLPSVKSGASARLARSDEGNAGRGGAIIATPPKTDSTVGCIAVIAVLAVFGYCAFGSCGSRTGPAPLYPSESASVTRSLDKPALSKQPSSFLHTMRQVLREGGWGRNPGLEKTVGECRTAAATFYAAAKSVSLVRKQNLKPGERKLIAQFRASTIRRQRWILPKLRARFAELWSRELWEDDIEARACGRGSRTIEFAGVTFASNANIKAFMDSAGFDLQAFRFTQARFKLYKGADEWTYFTIKSPKDSSFVLLGDGGFEVVK